MRERILEQFRRYVESHPGATIEPDQERKAFEAGYHAGFQFAVAESRRALARMNQQSTDQPTH